MGRGVTWEGNGGSFKSGVDSIRKTKGNADIFLIFSFFGGFRCLCGSEFGIFLCSRVPESTSPPAPNRVLFYTEKTKGLPWSLGLPLDNNSRLVLFSCASWRRSGKKIFDEF